MTCLIILNCTSSNSEWGRDKNYYLASLFEKNTFVNYYLIQFVNCEKERFYVLSKKTTPENLIPPFKYYERIISGNFYKVDLKRIDSVVVLRSKAGQNSGLIIHYDDELIEFCSNDTVRVPVYSSDNIFGLYIEKPE